MRTPKYRPPLSGRTLTFNVRLTEEEDAMLAEIAARQKKTCSELIRDFIKTEHARTFPKGRRP